MTNKTFAVVKLNDHQATNWKCDAGPVAILNPACTLHERIAYCFGLAKNLSAIADLGSENISVDVSQFAALVASALAPLQATLDALGRQTFDAEAIGSD